MKIFPTIAGNDFTKSLINTRLRDSKFKDPNFKTIADLSRESKIEETYEILSSIKLAWDIKVEEEEGMKAISESIKFYDIQDVESPKQNHDFNALEHCVKHGCYFPYDVTFFDFKVRVEPTNKSLINYVMEVFERIGGLILHCDKSKKMRILTKFSHDEKYGEHELTPNFDFGISANDSNLNKVVRCLGLDVAIRSEMNKMLIQKEIILVPILSILFLTKVL